jgi:hypothetical protein
MSKKDRKEGGWSWPALGPGTGLPIVAGEPRSVSGPMPATNLYLLITGAWLLLAVVGLFVFLQVVALLLALLGLLFGHHSPPGTLI